MNVLVFSDLHIPNHDEEAWKILNKVAKAGKWDHVVNLGDTMDFGCISRHNKNALRKVEGKRLQADYDLANKMLNELQKNARAKNKKAKFTFLEGNHDQWIEKWIDANPVVEGMFEVETQLNFKDRGIEWVRYDERQLFRLGKANFHHGIYATQYHAAKHAHRFGCNIFYGHVHDVQSFSKVIFGEMSEVVGQSIGCLCRKDLDYKRGRPDNWNHAFMTMHFLDNGNFHYQIHRIFDGKTVYNGKVYST